MNSETWQLLAGIMFGVMFAEVAWVISYWWIKTKGEWMKWPAGRSMMGLLGILGVITGSVTVNRIFFPFGWDGQQIFFLSLYLCLIWALAVVGLTIRAELIRKTIVHPNTPATHRTDKFDG